MCGFVLNEKDGKYTLTITDEENLDKELLTAAIVCMLERGEDRKKEREEQARVM